MTNPQPTLVLAPVLDLTQADSLKAELLAAFAQGAPVALEAGAVQRVSSPCLQVLVAASRRGAVLVNPSVPLREVAAALDLSAELGIA